MSKKSPDAYDVAVGARIRYHRLQAGISQEKLGEALGLTFQQIQKYEKGTNRCAPSRLVMMAKLFKININSFFPTDGKPEPEMQINTGVRREIMREFDRIGKPRIESAILHILQAI